MSDESSTDVHGLRAAAALTGRSRSGIEKLIDQGRLPARKDVDGWVFARGDLDPFVVRPDVQDLAGPSPPGAGTVPAAPADMVVSGATAAVPAADTTATPPADYQLLLGQIATLQKQIADLKLNQNFAIEWLSKRVDSAIGSIMGIGARLKHAERAAAVMQTNGWLGPR